MTTAVQSSMQIYTVHAESNSLENSRRNAFVNNNDKQNFPTSTNNQIDIYTAHVDMRKKILRRNFERNLLKT